MKTKTLPATVEAGGNNARTALERQDLFINQTIATFALQLLWSFIRNGGLDIHGYFINLESGRVSPLPIK